MISVFHTIKLYSLSNFLQVVQFTCLQLSHFLQSIAMKLGATHVLATMGARYNGMHD
jgi:hypothetical protein